MTVKVGYDDLAEQKLDELREEVESGKTSIEKLKLSTR